MADKEGALSFRMEGIPAFEAVMDKKSKAIQKNIVKAINMGAIKVQSDAVKSIHKGIKKGRIYIRKAHKNKTDIHRASAPGEAPASDTGNLASGIMLDLAKQNAPVALVISRAAYSNALEFGTEDESILPRPFMGPAFSKNLDDIQKSMILATNEGINK